MPRVLITLALATSLSAMTVWAAVGAAIERPADRNPLLVEIASPLRPTLAITIL